MTPESIWGNILSGVIGGLVVTVASHFLSQQRERKNVRETEKHGAKIAVLSIADHILSEIPNWKYEVVLNDLFRPTMNGLKTATFIFSCQLSEANRLKIEKALKDYQELDISYYSSVGEPDRAKIEQEHKDMTEALKKLRDAIFKA